MYIIQVYTPIDDLPKTVFGELTQHLENNAFIFLLLLIHCHSSISFSCDRTEIESDRDRIESQKSIGGKNTCSNRVGRFRRIQNWSNFLLSEKNRGWSTFAVLRACTSLNLFINYGAKTLQ